MITSFKPDLLRRTAVAFAAVAGFMFAGNAAAQSSVTLTGGVSATCQYSSMSVQPNGNVAVTCAGTVTGDPGVFTLNVNNAATVGTALTATVNRSVGTTGAVNLTYSITGAGCTGASGPINFADTSNTGQTFTVNPIAVGTCTVSLSNPTSGVLGTPNQTTVTVAAAGGGGGTVDGCPAVPTDVVDSTLIQSGLNILRLNSGRIAALPLPAVNAVRNSGVVKLGETTVSPSGSTTIEMTISKCKGVIDPTLVSGACYLRSTQGNLNSMTWIGKSVAGVTPAVADMMGWCLALQSDNVQKYVNVRFSYSSCTYAPCGFAIQWTDGSL